MTKEMLSDLSDYELRKQLTLIQDEIKMRRDLKIRETAYCIANAIQKVVDEGLILQESIVEDDYRTPNFIISDCDCHKLYRILPDYAERGDDECYGFTLEKWNDKKKEWGKAD